jgi:flagellar hook-basal body complex protein FliE
MNEAIGAVAAVSANGSQAVTLEARAVPGFSPAQTDFGAWFASELQGVNTQLIASERGLQALAAGDAISLHEVMMRAEEAKLSFQLMVQVRNRALEAYQEIMRAQG